MYFHHLICQIRNHNVSKNQQELSYLQQCLQRWKRHFKWNLSYHIWDKVNLKIFLNKIKLTCKMPVVFKRWSKTSINKWMIKDTCLNSQVIKTTERGIFFISFKLIKHIFSLFKANWNNWKDKQMIIKNYKKITFFVFYYQNPFVTSFVVMPIHLSPITIILTLVICLISLKSLFSFITSLIDCLIVHRFTHLIMRIPLHPGHHFAVYYYLPIFLSF